MWITKAVNSNDLHTEIILSTNNERTNREKADKKKTDRQRKGHALLLRFNTN